MVSTSLRFHVFKTLNVKAEWCASFCAVIGPNQNLITLRILIVALVRVVRIVGMV